MNILSYLPSYLALASALLVVAATCGIVGSQAPAVGQEVSPEVYGVSVPPNRFAGNAFIDGNKAADGTLIEALSGENVVGTTRASMLLDDFNYILDAARPSGGQPISFRVGGYPATETAYWQQGEVRYHFNLNAYTDAVAPPTDLCLTVLGEMVDRVEAVDGAWVEGCDSKVSTRGHSQYYGFTLALESEVTVTLESQDADTYLYLRKGETRSGAFLLENDDHQGSISVSLLQGTLEAGTYTVEATTYSAGQTGNFTVTVSGSATIGSGLPFHPCVDWLGQLQSNARLEGSWSHDCPSNNRQDHYAHFYIFNLPFRAEGDKTEVTILLESDVDTYLYLMEDDGKDGYIVAYNDDVEAGNTNSSISVPLAAGSYTIEATTYEDGKTGDFTLTIKGLGDPPPPPPCIVGQTLTQGDLCGYHNFTIEVDDSGDLLVRFPRDTAEAALDNFSIIRNGGGWTIEKLP